MFVCFVVCDEFQYVQWQCGCVGVECCCCFECECVVGCFCGQEKYVVEFVFVVCFQQWEYGVECFVDVGWCLCYQVLFVVCCVIDGYCQFVLVVVELFVWKCECMQCCVVCGVMGCFVFGLVDEVCVLFGEECCECGGIECFCQYGFVFGYDVEIYECDVDFCEIVCGVYQVCIDFCLCLVQCVMVGWYCVEVVVIGFDFFELVCYGIVVVCVVVYGECVLCVGQCDFGFVVCVVF